MAVKLDIAHCTQCPHHKQERYYTADSFEFVQTLYCGKTDRPKPECTDRMPQVPDSSRIGYIETGVKEETIAIPKWCPLR